ncbi:hypothetical protein [Enterococcus termitis]|uniref:DUF1433 domain-containing protein n=1 Tax=Enterococcus termitis TaxID=332950 RepID=A0A1E5GB12_9ENTE|nr:hypothetical protein [Enterococcus termitis]OEG09883.1 hypothetical protein BCR25_10295 [Enterococcus termitis]OJG98391.1 hypothetical protein RV18_GL003292 [Enterococcus termitis]
MKKKKRFIGLLVFILIGGVGLFTFNQNAKERKEQQVIKMETTIVKLIKDRFADVKVVDFISEMSGGYNDKTGYWTFTVNITTDKGTSSPGTIHFSSNQQKDLGAFGPIDSDFDKIVLNGKTQDKVRVIYSNGSESEV